MLQFGMSSYRETLLLEQNDILVFPSIGPSEDGTAVPRSLHSALS